MRNSNRTNDERVKSMKRNNDLKAMKKVAYNRNLSEMKVVNREGLSERYLSLLAAEGYEIQ